MKEAIIVNTKIAVIADSHGNATALKAVIEDAKKLGVQEYWSLGDIAFGGSSSEDCFEMLNEVNTTQYLMGNWESAYLDVIDNKSVDLSDPSDIYFISLVRYEQQYFSATRSQQIRDLPMNNEKEILGTVFSLTHNLPNKNRGHSLFPDKKESNFDKLEIDKKMDVAIYAHTHTPVWRYTTDGQMILTPGSVGQPWYSRKKLMHNRDASYLVLSLSDSKIEGVDFRRIPYSIDEELAHAKNLGHPYLDLYKKLLMTGQPSTHDKDVLQKINRQNHYKQKAENFLNQLPK